MSFGVVEGHRGLQRHQFSLGAEDLRHADDLVPFTNAVVIM